MFPEFTNPIFSAISNLVPFYLLTIVTGEAHIHQQTHLHHSLFIIISRQKCRLLYHSWKDFSKKACGRDASQATSMRSSPMQPAPPLSPITRYQQHSLTSLSHHHSPLHPSGSLPPSTHPQTQPHSQNKPALHFLGSKLKLHQLRNSEYSAP